MQPIVFLAQHPAATETNPVSWPRLRRTGAVDSPLLGAGGDGAYRSHIVIDGFYFNYNEGAMPSRDCLSTTALAYSRISASTSLASSTSDSCQPR